MLSSDLSTLFTGRTFEIEVFPFSFEEYRLYSDEGEVDRDFDEYARTGGMSGSYPYPLQEQRYQYLSNVFKTLIVRDIVQRHNVRNESALLHIADYMMDNVSNITSARNITDVLNADGLKITNKTVGTYMGYLCDAFAFLEEGEELQSFHESGTTVNYPSKKVSAQTRLAVRSEGDYWGPESLGFSWELPQLTRTQEGEAE